MTKKLKDNNQTPEINLPVKKGEKKDYLLVCEKEMSHHEVSQVMYAPRNGLNWVRNVFLAAPLLAISPITYAIYKLESSEARARACRANGIYSDDRDFDNRPDNLKDILEDLKQYDVNARRGDFKEFFKMTLIPTAAVTTGITTAFKSAVDICYAPFTGGVCGYHGKNIENGDVSLFNQEYYSSRASNAIAKYSTYQLGRGIGKICAYFSR